MKKYTGIIVMVIAGVICALILYYVNMITETDAKDMEEFYEEII